mgnify:CR=1 FL=1
MNLLWKQDKPMTSVEILAIGDEHSWSDNYLPIMLKSLLKKKAIEVCGYAQCGTQYARQFRYLLSREEYVARLAVGRGLLVGGQQALFVQCLQQFVFQLAVAGRILKSVILYHVGIPPLSSISCDPEPERSGTQTALVNSRKRPHCRS